jgi:hypothetical protein
MSAIRVRAVGADVGIRIEGLMRRGYLVSGFVLALSVACEGNGATDGAGWTTVGGEGRLCSSRRSRGRRGGPRQTEGPQATEGQHREARVETARM